MDGWQVNQDMMNLMMSLKPFLNDKGKNLVDAGEAFAQLFTTEHAARAMQLMKELSGSNPAIVKADTTGNFLQGLFKGNWAFAVFLILVLLFFSAGPLKT